MSGENTGRLEMTTAKGNTSAEKSEEKTGPVSMRQKDSTPHSVEPRTKQLEPPHQSWEKGVKMPPNNTAKTAKSPKLRTKIKIKLNTNYKIKPPRIVGGNPQGIAFKNHKDEKPSHTTKIQASIRTSTEHPIFQKCEAWTVRSDAPSAARTPP